MSEAQVPYRVLARKYRPKNFDELIGQDALVRTLRNAIESGRVAHAFMLTGVRGIGKTTTARIIAKALNYTGPDGKAGPTTGPTEDCAVCRAIAEDRHPDVMEMDAASRTGVDDIREILDGVRYAPTSARYKIYIIDEVHMLSKNAFNALLKTLEEPPAHVKFIFATTEIRKVPVTVLSRCQRFDLRRVDVPTLSAHYANICKKENAQAEDEAIALIARAADGSVRDGLSLLDQAIALGGGKVTAAQVKDMLGLADRARVLDLFEATLKGDCPQALSIMADLHRAGADPLVLMQDLLDFTHIMTRFRAAPDQQGQQQAMAKEELARAGELAGKLSMPSLGRAWQILLKGIQEVGVAPNPQKAAEMIVIRLAYAAELPDPADLIRRLKDQPQMPLGGMGGGMGQGIPGTPAPATLMRAVAGGAPMNPAPLPQPAVEPFAQLDTLQDVVALLEQNGAMILASQLYQYAHLVRLEVGRLEFRPEPEAPQKLAQDISQKLKELTGTRWMVSVSQAAGAPTLAESARAAQQEKIARVRAAPLVEGILEVFPDAEITAIHTEGKK